MAAGPWMGWVSVAVEAQNLIRLCHPESQKTQESSCVFHPFCGISYREFCHQGQLIKRGIKVPLSHGANLYNAYETHIYPGHTKHRMCGLLGVT